MADNDRLRLGSFWTAVTRGGEKYMRGKLARDAIPAIEMLLGIELTDEQRQIIKDRDATFWLFSNRRKENPRAPVATLYVTPPQGEPRRNRGSSGGYDTGGGGGGGYDTGSGGGSGYDMGD